MFGSLGKLAVTFEINILMPETEQRMATCIVDSQLPFRRHCSLQDGHGDMAALTHVDSAERLNPPSGSGLSVCNPPAGTSQDWKNLIAIQSSSQAREAFRPALGDALSIS